MENFGLMLIVIGIVIVLFGIVFYFGAKYLGLGQLPGDFKYEGKGLNFYFPLASCIVISIIVSLVLLLIRVFGK